MGRHIGFLLRLTAPLLLLSFLAPAPDRPDPAPAAPALPTDELRIIITKSAYTLALYRGDRLLKSYRAVFGKGYEDGDKQRQGDKRTPEGDFYICSMNASRKFYKFLGLSYPGVKHAEHGLRSRLISLAEYVKIKTAIDGRQRPPWDTPLGGAVGIHGRMLRGQAAPATTNWTDGCVALDNADVDEIFNLVSLGTPVTILP